MVCSEEHIHSDQCDHSDRGVEYSLYTQIDTESIRSFNIKNAENTKKIFKPYEQRFDITDYIESDDDEQLIIHIPFTSSIKLKSISLLGFNDETTPNIMKVFINNDQIDFSNVNDIEPTQKWNLVENVTEGNLPEYPTKITLFSNVRSLTIYIESNFGGDTTKISYIGLKGEYTFVNKDPIITVYELASNPADHKLSQAESKGGLIQ
jgi:hypothetical protein